ncbi:MAG: lipase [Oscillospiraceae bacterium]|nr:lipase [Oscillospiraceae bacterium]
MTERPDMHWASVWGNAVSIGESRPESYSKNITMRYPIYSQFGGTGLRLTFDNYCGTEPITISKATVLIGDTFYRLSFKGESGVTIPARGYAVTDSLECQVQAQSTFAISFYLADYTLMRSTVFTRGPLSTGQYALGDQTEVKDFPIELSKSTHLFYFLTNVSVYTSTENRTIVCYGDSITAQDWPDYLTLRCKELGKNHTAIVRRATSGSRILREYDNITYASYGLKGSRRFHHEVPTDGADTVIIQHGINDIIHPVGTDVNPFRPMSDLPTVEEMITGLKRYIYYCRAFGYKVYVGTLLPIEGWRTYAPFRDELRNAYNDWIRTTNLIDGCIDFDKALRDPANSAAFRKDCDSGDHLHPSAFGYLQMAGAVPEELLK